MTETLEFARVTSMLAGAVAQIRANHEMLSRLDSAVGDGDHGTTILRAMEAMGQTLTADANSDLKTLLANAGWAVMSCDGGSTGPLLGSFFLGMSEAAPCAREIDAAGLTAAFESAVAKMQKQSRAGIGDKTMMDAILPAMETLRSADSGAGVKLALTKAAEAAAAGAEATKAMRARFGRARNLGDRVIGHADPGAVSVSLIFKGFSEGI